VTLSEFKAWFEGFCEGIEGAPTEEQFAKIREKVADLRPEPVLPHLPLAPPPVYPNMPIYPTTPYIVPSTPGTGSPPYYTLPEVWC